MRLLGTDIDVVGDDEDDDDDDDDFVVVADEIVVELEFAIAVVVVSVLLEETFVTDGDVDEIMVLAEDDSFVFDVEETFVVVAGVAERDVDSIDVFVDSADVLEAIDVDIVAVVDVAVVDVFVGTILVVTAVVVVAAAAVVVVVVVVAVMVVVVATVVVVVVDKGGAARVGHSRDVHGRVHSQLQAVPVNSQDGFCHVDVNGDVPFAPEPNKNLK